MATSDGPAAKASLGRLRGAPPPTEASLCPTIVYAPPPDEGLDLVHEDDTLLVLNKPAGLLSVPGRGEAHQDCLVHRVQRRFSDALTVHRLDLATSGLIVMARGPAAQAALGLAFHDRRVHKRYEALLQGVMPDGMGDEGEVALPLNTDWLWRPMQKVDHERGKPALTRWRVLARDAAGQRTRVALEPLTGRSHQLRVHMLALGHPMLGDPLYGTPQSQAAAPRLCLHACELGLAHPLSGEALVWLSPAPF
jgi:tRNA pseudouridine32 synthase/23S rRNA pseudouridine746 synthase